MLWTRQELGEVLRSTQNWVVHKVIEKSLKAFNSFLDYFGLIVVLFGCKYFLRDVYYNASWIMHLDNLYQPFKIIISSVHLFLALIFEVSFDHKLTVAIDRPCRITNLKANILVVE